MSDSSPTNLGLASGPVNIALDILSDQITVTADRSVCFIVAISSRMIDRVFSGAVTR